MRACGRGVDKIFKRNLHGLTRIAIPATFSRTVGTRRLAVKVAVKVATNRHLPRSRLPKGRLEVTGRISVARKRGGGSIDILQVHLGSTVSIHRGNPTRMKWTDSILIIQRCQVGSVYAELVRVRILTDVPLNTSPY
jgi:hypothetical protein